MRNHPAVIMARSGTVVTHGDLEDRSCRLARAWHRAGLRPGDHVALVSENHHRFHEVYRAALRSGLYLTPINRHLSPEEISFVVGDGGATAVVTSTAQADRVAAALVDRPAVGHRWVYGGAVAGFDTYEDVVAAESADPPDHQPRGDVMMYSSGTTGRPKGIKRPLPARSYGEATGPTLMGRFVEAFGIDDNTRYLSPAPLYHAAPLGYTAAVIAAGGTAVIMEHFDAADALDDLERHRITHSQWVPTMFVRMLKLADEQRLGRDLGHHRVAIHAAAPCPVEIKRAMIDWWGPILWEYYAGSEGNGITLIDSHEWLARPGSVGRALLGTPHICDEGGAELSAGEVGTIYFEQDQAPFAYHGDPDRTAITRHPDHPHLTTIGDLGHLDGEGYLYLLDRQSFVIISGGVNVYPREVEDCLIVHPAVADVAVVGRPDPDMGEAVHALVEVIDGVAAGPELAGELIDHARSHIAHFKAPRSVEFVDDVGRSATGKLRKGRTAAS